jgi:hypothetical protein
MPDVTASDEREAWLVHTALLEGLSVVAFQRLEQELRAHHAPHPLLARVTRAIHDEQRHHATMSALLGRRVAVPRVPRHRRRGLTEMLTENAVEGCVHETFGAAVALWQARTATDANVRRAMTGIARDEAMHAELAHRVHRWGYLRLDRAERARVDRARSQAVRALRRVLAAGVSRPHHRALGIPSPCDALRLFDAVVAIQHTWIGYVGQ